MFLFFDFLDFFYYLISIIGFSKFYYIRLYNATSSLFKKKFKDFEVLLY